MTNSILRNKPKLPFLFVFVVLAGIPGMLAQTPRLKLEELEQLALENNPSLKQVRAAVQAAEGRRRQAGLYPNPTIGYIAEEVAPGPTIRYGEHGFFAEQRIVTGGKLGIARGIGEQNVRQAQAAAQAQQYRVLNALRSLYYQALGEQKLVQVQTQLAALAARAVKTTSELANVGQADRPDLLAVEVEAQRLELGLITAQNALDGTWRQIAAVVGKPDLRPAPLEGDIEQLPALDFEAALGKIYEESPELRSAELEVAASDLGVRQARAAVIPDIFTRGGVLYNRELLEVGRRPVGWEGMVEIGISLPIFNRNQGAIATARAEAERARYGVQRTRMELRSRLARVYREYQNSLASVERFRTQMIPKAQLAYELYLNRFRQMAAAYPQVLISQRNLFQLQEDYISALIRAWQRSIEIQGLLLLGGVETGESLAGAPGAGAVPMSASEGH